MLPRGQLAGLLTVMDVREGALQPGDRVDAEALETVRQFSTLMPEVGAVQYSEANGLSFAYEGGWAVYVGTSEEMERKVANLRAIVHTLASEGVRPQMIDVRFVESPYYRLP